MTNESIDESSFYFNPFKTINIDDQEEAPNFDTYPNQETYIGSENLDSEPLRPACLNKTVRGANEIIGDISSENVLSHCRRGEPESFATTASNNDDTITYHQVMNLLKKDDWSAALKKETNNMADYHVWDVIERSNTDKPLNCTWVFKIKPKSSNQSLEYKARLCMQGFKEVFGKDYNTTFTPTGKLVSLCMLISFALQRNLKFHQINVKCAFLNGPIRERITLNPPPGIDVPYNSILLLKKALYGLKKAPKEWHLTLSSWLLSVGFNQSYAETCVFWSLNTWLYVYVDDIAIFSDEPKIFIKMISKRFKIEELGSAKHLLGMKVTQLNSCVLLTQTQYIEDTLTKYGCQDLFSLATPMFPGSHLVKASSNEIEEYLAFNVHYQGLVGALNYLSVTTRPNINFAVGCLSQFLNNPGIKHWNAACHVLRYLKGTKDFGITLCKTPINQTNILSYVDQAGQAVQSHLNPQLAISYYGTIILFLGV
jgi:hypothetical protein